MQKVGLGQSSQVYTAMDEILTNLDDKSIAQLLGGYENDIDKLIGVMYEETSSALSFTPSILSDPNITHLEALSKDIEKTLRFMSFSYFTASALPEFSIGTHHLEWFNLCQLIRHLAIVAARGHSKSQTFSYAYILWKLYRYRKAKGNHIAAISDWKYQMSREGALITNEISLARYFLDKIATEIKENEIIHEVLMPFDKRKLGSDELELKNGSRIYIKSAGSRMRGFHPTFAVIDDFLDESSLYSAEQREKFWNIFSKIICMI